MGQGMCIWLLNTHGDKGPLGALDLVGVVIFIVGLVIEHVADMQKSRFNASTKSDGQRSWISSGLWSISRHPNYLGENILWVGLALIASGNQLFGSFLRMSCFVSPVWSWFFLVFTSMMLLEKRMDLKFAGVPGYIRYKETTPVLVPNLFPSFTGAGEVMVPAPFLSLDPDAAEVQSSVRKARARSSSAGRKR